LTNEEQYQEGKRLILELAEESAKTTRPKVATSIAGPQWIADANKPAVQFEFGGKRLQYFLTTEMVEDYPNCPETQRIVRTELPAWLDHSAQNASGA
jgi:hypothetical protein